MRSPLAPLGGAVQFTTLGTAGSAAKLEEFSALSSAKAGDKRGRGECWSGTTGRKCELVDLGFWARIVHASWSSC